MKVRIVVQPTGLINGQPWAPVGEEMDLPEAVVEAMKDAGYLEVVETRPAAKKGVEKRDTGKAKE
jgi:hypothetical protein